MGSIQKFLHDSYAQICAPLCRIRRAEAYQVVVEKRETLTPSSSTEFTNDLESFFYNNNRHIYKVHHPHTELVNLENSYVVGFQSFVYDKHLRYIQLDKSHDDLSSKHVRRPIPFFCRKIYKPLLFLGSRYTDNHYHFVFEQLPLIQYAINRIKFSKDHVLMTTYGQGQWQSEYLTRLGLAPEQIIETSFGTTWFRSAQIVPNLPMAERSAPYEPESYKSIVAAMLPERKNHVKDTDLFISRNDAARRRVTNEDQLFETARRYFPLLKRIYLSKLSLSEQLNLFDSCRVLIGPVGQAFRNVLFCRKSLCVELIPGHCNKRNPFAEWIPNSRFLAYLHENAYLPLYSNSQPEGDNSDWHFAVDEFERSIRQARQLKERLYGE